jgi:hypothetical protein
MAGTLMGSRGGIELLSSAQTRLAVHPALSRQCRALGNFSHERKLPSEYLLPPEIG